MWSYNTHLIWHERSLAHVRTDKSRMQFITIVDRAWYLSMRSCSDDHCVKYKVCSRTTVPFSAIKWPVFNDCHKLVTNKDILSLFRCPTLLLFLMTITIGNIVTLPSTPTKTLLRVWNTMLWTDPIRASAYKHKWLFHFYYSALCIQGRVHLTSFGFDSRIVICIFNK